MAAQGSRRCGRYMGAAVGKLPHFSVWAASTPSGAFFYRFTKAGNIVIKRYGSIFFVYGGYFCYIFLHIRKILSLYIRLYRLLVYSYLSIPDQSAVPPCNVCLVIAARIFTVYFRCPDVCCKYNINTKKLPQTIHAGMHHLREPVLYL